MDNNSDSSFPAIDTNHFYYIGTAKGNAVCNNRFTTPEKALKYFLKAMKKPEYLCFIYEHSVNVFSQIEA